MLLTVLGYDNEVMLAYDTEDGKEFLSVGVKIGNSSSQSFRMMSLGILTGIGCSAAGNFTAYDKEYNYYTGSTGPYDTDPVLMLQHLLSGSRYL